MIMVINETVRLIMLLINNTDSFPQSTEKAGLDIKKIKTTEKTKKWPLPRPECKRFTQGLILSQAIRHFDGTALSLVSLVSTLLSSSFADM